jgi:hypothetical protein
VQLELSSEGRYALRALVYLAWADKRVTADRISTEAHIPRRLLARILAKGLIAAGAPCFSPSRSFTPPVSPGSTCRSSSCCGS